MYTVPVVPDVKMNTCVDLSVRCFLTDLSMGALDTKDITRSQDRNGAGLGSGRVPI